MEKLKASEIIIKRSERQRKQLGSVQDLADSIKRIGQINPITITKDRVLIAGERRLAACKLLGATQLVLVRYMEDLSTIDLQLLELEENLKRSDLAWQDQVRAIRNMHNILSSKNEKWSVTQTAEHLGFKPTWVYQMLEVGKEIETNNKVLEMPTLSKAVANVERKRQREVDNEINNIVESVARSDRGEVDVAPEQTDSIITGTAASIQCEDFSKWASAYTGRRFNLLHCDFPYGIDHQKSEQGNISKGSFEGYADSEDVYWNLCKVLCDNLDKIALPSCHLMFWFSMKFYNETIAFIEKHSDFELVDPRPMVWVKDGGIAADVQRRPRNVYETALLFSRGDRKIVSCTNNAITSPKVKTFHPSEKPEAVLTHFFRLFIDEYAEVLDPTCGSGTAIRVAKRLGAKRALGLEINPEFAAGAKSYLDRS